MDYIYISFRTGAREQDIKVPGTMKVSELILILRGLYGGSGKEMHSDPPGVVLQKNLTLNEQEIETGACLRLI